MTSKSYEISVCKRNMLSSFLSQKKKKKKKQQQAQKHGT